MLRVLGHASAACDGMTRRDLLRAGVLSMFAGAASGKEARPAGRAKAVILIDLYGGPSHIDSFDPKPDAPSGIRGEFATIPTALPGIRVTEHLPRLARMMSDLCLIRTVSHGYNAHNPYAVMTGFTRGDDRTDYFSKPTNHPSMGSVCQYVGLGRRSDLPGYVVLPAVPGYAEGLRRAGPYGGYLGSQYDPLFSTCSPTWGKPDIGMKDFYDPTHIPMGVPKLPQVTNDLTLDALDGRRTLLEQFEHQARKMEASVSAGVMSYRQRQALDLLLSTSARTAFDMDREPAGVRERYGRDLFGSSVLLARRLVEAGVTFVTVHTEAKGNGHWDTHENNFEMLKRWLLPFLDRALSALVEDLKVRGLLDSTLVLTTGDMGRSPRVNGKAGRDHWPQCGFAVLAGGGVKPGFVLGTTDRQAGFPLSHPVSPGDLVATVYRQLGIDPELTVPDHTGRPVHVAHGGAPIRAILA
jgi:hypothetical protein